MKKNRGSWLKKGETEKIKEVLYHVAESIRRIAEALQPFLPSTSEKILRQLGFKKGRGYEIKKEAGMFPRIEEKKDYGQRTTDNGQKTRKGENMENQEPITISDFAKVDLRIAQVLEAERVEGADKLLKLQIDLGTEKRQIVAGIAQHYTPEELIGRKIVVVANLTPAKIRGVESNGMLLAASGAETISILTPFKDVPVGAKVK